VTVGHLDGLMSFRIDVSLRCAARRGHGGRFCRMTLGPFLVAWRFSPSSVMPERTRTVPKRGCSGVMKPLDARERFRPQRPHPRRHPASVR